MRRIVAVYKIQSKVKPERIYIGSTFDLRGRWASHMSELRHNRHHSIKLQNHFNKYGENDLIFSMILECEEESVINIEQYFIDALNPYFNICKVAGNCKGVKHSEETRRKMSLSSTGFRHSEETKAKMRLIAMGRKQSKEAREKMSLAKKGVVPWNKGKKGIYSDECRLKISNRRKGKATTLGYKHSEATKLKIKEARARRKTKQNISAA